MSTVLCTGMEGDGTGFGGLEASLVPAFLRASAHSVQTH